MLIIDEHTETKLAETLDAMRRNPEIAARCIHFFNPADKHRDLIIKLVDEHIVLSEPQIYFCEDGDIFVIAPVIPGRDARKLMFEYAANAGIEIAEKAAHLHDIDTDIGQILNQLEHKLEKQRRRIAEIKKLNEAKQTEQRRKIILDNSNIPLTGEITARRNGRNIPELMIIEDDAFSLKLVSNVLQKKYPLTGLNSADRALETYARLAPDILFLDINLPDVTGHELLEKIMASDPSACVVMISGNSDMDNVTQAMKLGAKGFIAKPFTSEKLLQYINRYVPARV